MHLAKRLKVRGWDVSVISIMPPKAFVDQLDESGIRVMSLGLTGGLNMPRAFLKLVRILRKEKPDVLHTHMVHANIIGRIARLFVGIPVVIATIHSMSEGSGAKEKRRLRAYRLTDRQSDLTTNVSQAGVDRYEMIGVVPPGKGAFVPNGVDTDLFSPDGGDRLAMRSELGLSDAEFFWLAVGRFDPAKDYANMLKAFAIVAGNNRDAVLMIAGGGDARKKYESLASTLGIEKRVVFLGLRKDIPRLMRSADGYVMSSSREGMPMVLLEAGAAGLPLVATDVGGIASLVRDGETGYLVPSKDHEALGQAMLNLMGLPHTDRIKMGAAARELIVSSYSLDSIVDRWEGIYSKLMEIKGIG